MFKEFLTFFLLLVFISIASAETISPKEIVKKHCTACHDLDRVYKAEKSQADWESTVDRMISYGSQLNKKERKAVIEYLSKKK